MLHPIGGRSCVIRSAIYRTKPQPGHDRSQIIVMTIPTSPAEASSKEATSFGPIGMALNGVAYLQRQRRW